MKRKIILTVIGVFLIILVGLGLSYSFFSAEDIKLNNQTQTHIKTAELGLTFTGIEEINLTSMVPGNKDTKTFSVENTSNSTLTYNIYLEGITNEFNVDLIYTLKEGSNTLIEDKALPASYGEKIYLLRNIEINAKETKTYTLTVEYKYTEEDQSEYMGSDFEATVGIDAEQLSNAICKRATTLHTETCNQSSTGQYCVGAGYTTGSTIKYGNETITDGTLTSGDAFDCDVNGDGVYNPETERFYYVSEYYNTTTKQFDTSTAVLIYYNNVSGGTANNTTKYAYDISGENWHGPVTAIEQLPTTSVWSNVSLKNIERVILNETGGTTTAGNHSLLTNFSYEGYATHF